MKLETPELPCDIAGGPSEIEAVAPPVRSTAIAYLDRGVRFASLALAFLIILAVFTPLNPMMPGPWLDMSWMMAMNQAVAQHLAFGKDIVFTFGPFASIYTEVYHPATDRLMLGGSLFLGVAYFAALYLLTERQRRYCILLFPVILAALVVSRDALLLSYPLLLALVIDAVARPGGETTGPGSQKVLENSTAILFAPLALLALIKVSLYPVCVIIAGFCSLLLWYRGKKFLACAGPATAIVGVAVFWTIAGQPLSALPRYFAAAARIIAGYTEAMQVNGDAWECAVYALAATVLVMVIITAPSAGHSRIFLAASFALFLFMAFKGAFVRHDPWHNITGSSAIIVAAFLLLIIIGEKRAILPLALAALTCVYIGDGTIQNAMVNASLNFKVRLNRTIHGAIKRLKPGTVEEEYEKKMAAIRVQFPIDRLQGTTDIYSLNQSWLFASGDTWAPRPVVQSYSAYTSGLAELNLRHLTSAEPPENIIFRVEPIDGRLPSLEDGASWPAILNEYSLTKLRKGTAYLRKRMKAQPQGDWLGADVDRSTHKFGEDVTLPAAEDPLVAEIDAHLTVSGQILSTVFKPPQLHLVMHLRDGDETSFRAVSTMMKSSFVISPLVTSTQEFALLAAGGTKYLAGNEVKSFSITSDDSSGSSWNPVYSLTLQKLELPKDSEAARAVLFDTHMDPPPGSASPPSLLACEGGVDSLNGKIPTSAEKAVRGALYVNGWMGVAPEKGMVPDSVFVWLKGEDGTMKFVRAKTEPRDDIKQHFHQPDMPDPGFAAMIDFSDLQGRYTLGLARMYKGHLGICKQFNFPLLVNPPF